MLGFNEKTQRKSTTCYLVVLVDRKNREGRKERHDWVGREGQ